MSPRIESAIFTAMLTAVAILFLAMAWGLESKSRLAPLLLAGAILPLTLYQLRLDLASDPHDNLEPAPPQQKQSLAWALALPPAIYLLGCLGAVLLHTLLFVRIQGQRSWRMATVCAALAGIPVFALARAMLRPELLTGALWNLFS